MVTVDQMNAFLTIAAVAAVYVLAGLYRRCMRQRAAAARPGCWGPGNKPQRRFKHVLADNSYRPFKHLQREGQDKEMSLKIHPYEKEINLLLEQPPTMMKFITIHECPHMGASCIWIHTEQQLEFLARLLSKEKVFAVDTEQHNVRSFLGFTALIQVSTEREDFLIDTIALHDVMSILQPIFSDSAICKVFHGSDSDVLWLQRDFHIYVVNMFDTSKACEVLSKPYKSLAYLLETYCRISTDKSFQLEDWRQRPISQDMIQYARCDAHYLLYIACCLASELQNETHDFSDDKYKEVCRLSNKICLKLYDKDIESSPRVAASSIYSRNCDMLGNTISNCEMKDRVWKMCAWRDLMARIHDESLKYVISDEAIVALAMKYPVEPIEVYGIIAEADSTYDSSNIKSALPSPSPIVSSHLNELFFLLQETDANLDDAFIKHMQNHLAPTGCCALSIYNYALSFEFILRGKSPLFLKQCGGKPVTPIGTREHCVKRFSCKSQSYLDCRIYTSDGKLVSYCKRKSLQWYLDRKLGTLVENDPQAINLNFKPKGHPQDEDNVFLTNKSKCVGCGEKNHFLRYRVIPSCYKNHFPKHLKIYRGIDTVPLCIDCQNKANKAAEKFKNQIADEFKIPLCVRRIVDKGKNMTPKSVCGVKEEGSSSGELRSAALTLLRFGSKLPPERHAQLVQIVRNYFGEREITGQDLEIASHVGESPRQTRRFYRKNRSKSKQSGTAIPMICKSTCPDTTESGSALNVIFQSHEPSEGRDISEFDVGNKYQSDDKGGSSSFLRYQVSNRDFKKLSLIGHEHHGEQVVEHLLHTEGEDGIRQFCKRWRQVFLKAVCPRFLPSGW